MVQPVSFCGGKTKIKVNSREFYDKHPDLAPRNVYLYLGRVKSAEEIDKYMKKFDEPFYVRAKNWVINKVKNIFNRDKK